jgi:hypothetical protein
MTELLNKAFAALQRLSASEQDEAARALLDYVESLAAPRLTEAQLAQVRASLAERLFLSDDETAALYARYRA